MSEHALPDGPLLAYLGDDFTGSTDAMEVFSAAGLPTVLFLAPPAPQWVERFHGMRCIGLASTARAQSPAWMDEHLPDAFARLRRFGAPLLQYKVCSTFDSSPERGSIGRAVDLGVAAVGGRCSPMVVGAPRLRRWQAFGNLFAAFGDEVHRLDRHPTMMCHPATPMHESDLRRHLAPQSARRSALVDLVALKTGLGEARRDAALGDDAPIVLYDVVDDETQAEAGRLIWQGRADGIFSASSSGLQYALVAHWRRAGLLPADAALPVGHAVDRIAIVSGSCSPVTADQIAWAADNGFHAERLRLDRLLPAGTREAEIARAVDAAANALAAGRSPLVYSASGPQDLAVTGFNAMAAGAGLTWHEATDAVGAALAEVMQRLLDRHALQRIVVAGGDSSGAVAGALGIAALSVAAGLVPGAPICRAWSDDPRRDGLEVVLKGGQLGTRDFFGRVLQGR